MSGRFSSVLVASVLALTAGCSVGTSPSPSPPPMPDTPSAQASPAPSADDLAGQEALAAYRGMWDDFVAAGTTSDWQSTSLGRHATGQALTNLSRGLYADSANGLVTRGAPVLSPEVSSVEPSGAPVRVIVADCGDSTNWLKYREDDGTRATDGSGGRRLINALVERQSDGSWKVSDYGVQELGSC
ncbi:hypothetical protein [Pseudonocardia sp.]|uniref:hypothetical protein n=1 Tax=Pseudonocardia sp. TaxID=60912 RepID=UPI00260B8EA6|nr:hypothetical protein [Pseudonocardia sp.]